MTQRLRPNARDSSSQTQDIAGSRRDRVLIAAANHTLIAAVAQPTLAEIRSDKHPEGEILHKKQLGTALKVHSELILDTKLIF